MESKHRNDVLLFVPALSEMRGVGSCKACVVHTARSAHRLFAWALKGFVLG